MSALYTLKVITDFAASHILEGHPGKCARLHGHNWTLEVEAEARSLNSIGMAMDFADLKALVSQVVDDMDHRHLNDLADFDGINPTAEHLAAVVYRRVAEGLADYPAEVTAVTVWETPRAGVRYTRSDDSQPR